jgi:hypothetical protein
LGCGWALQTTGVSPGAITSSFHEEVCFVNSFCL